MPMAAVARSGTPASRNRNSLGHQVEAVRYFAGMRTETHTFIGETSTDRFDGWAGFRIGQPIEPEVVENGGGMGRVRLAGAPWAGVAMSFAQHKK